MSAELVGEQAVIANIPWDVTVTPTKPKLAEFSQLAGLYSEVDKNFGLRTEGTGLVIYIGDENSSTHRVDMMFATDVKGELKGGMLFSTAQYLAVMKLAGNNPTSMSITRGVLRVTVETDHANYSYYLRGNR
jgi:hypothetical protein